MRTTVKALMARLAGMNPDEQIIGSVMTIDDVLDVLGIDERFDELDHLKAHDHPGTVLESYCHWVVCRHPMHESYHDEMAAADDDRARCDQVVADLRAAADAAFDKAMDALIAKELEGGAA